MYIYVYRYVDQHVLSDSIPEYAAFHAETISLPPPKTLLKMILIDLFN